MNTQQVRSWPVVLIQGSRVDGNALVMDKQDDGYGVISVDLDTFYKSNSVKCSTVDEEEATHLLNSCHMMASSSVPELMETHLQRFRAIGRLRQKMGLADARTIQA